MNLINPLKEGSVFSTLLSSPVFILTPQYLCVIILLGRCALYLGCCCCALAQLCPALCDHLGCSTPDSPALHHLLELSQIQEQRQSYYQRVGGHTHGFLCFLALHGGGMQATVGVCMLWKQSECGDGIWMVVKREWASLVAQWVKNLPAVQETGVRSLGWEDPWRRKWQPIPVSLPGKSHGQRSLVGCNPWGHKESGTTNTNT